MCSDYELVIFCKGLCILYLSLFIISFLLVYVFRFFL